MGCHVHYECLWTKVGPKHSLLKMMVDITNSAYNRVLLKRQSTSSRVKTMNQYQQDHIYMLD